MNNKRKRILLQLLRQFKLNQQKDFVNGTSKISAGFTTHIRHDKNRNIIISIMLQNQAQHAAFQNKILNAIYTELQKQLSNVQIAINDNIILITKSKDKSFSDIASVLKRIVKRINYIS